MGSTVLQNYFKEYILKNTSSNHLLYAKVTHVVYPAMTFIASRNTTENIIIVFVLLLHSQMHFIQTKLNNALHICLFF